MVSEIYFKGRSFKADLSAPTDISIPLKEGTETVNCFFAPPFETFPVIEGDFIGSTEMGGPLNFLNIRLNPHGNGTHTECVGHISREKYTLNKCLENFHFIAKVISVFPTKMENGDRVILKTQIVDAVNSDSNFDALIIRTLPNDDSKLDRNYSGTNPPYLHHEAAAWIADEDIRHLLIDLPSVDREKDEGKLLAHKAFWKYPEEIRSKCTLTELIYVPNKLKDGLFLLNLQVASFEIDVSPSKPVLYTLK